MYIKSWLIYLMVAQNTLGMCEGKIGFLLFFRYHKKNFIFTSHSRNLFVINHLMIETITCCKLNAKQLCIAFLYMKCFNMDILLCIKKSWLLYSIVAHNTLRTCEKNWDIDLFKGPEKIKLHFCSTRALSFLSNQLLE